MQSLMFSLMFLFGATEESSASDVFSQIKANVQQVRTAHFRFECSERLDGKLTRDGKTETKSWRGEAWFVDPCMLRVEYHDGRFSNLRTFVSTDRDARSFVMSDQTGIAEGKISNGGLSEHNEASAVGVLMPHGETQSWERFALKIDRWKAVWSGDKIQLIGPWFIVDQTCHWEVDAQKGFSIVGRRRDVPTSIGLMHTSLTNDVFEAAPGIWFSQKQVHRQVLDGNVVREFQTEVIPGTLTVNQPIPSSRFELRFPKGTKVSDQIRNVIYFEGGRDSRDRNAVTALAAEAQQLANQNPQPLKSNNAAVKSTIQAPSNSASRWGFRLSLGVTGLACVGAIVFYFRRRA